MNYSKLVLFVLVFISPNLFAQTHELSLEGPTMFIRDYLTVKLKRICNIDNLYFDFKQFDINVKIGRKELLEKMLVYARYYEQIVKGKTDSKRLNKKLHQLDALNSSVDMPFYLAFFNYAKENNMGEDEIYKVLDIIEGYWARRIVCNLPANALAKVFAMLHYDVLRIVSIHEKRQLPLIEVRIVKEAGECTLSEKTVPDGDVQGTSNL